MKFTEFITGSDMDNKIECFSLRVQKLPADYQKAWGEIVENIWVDSDFTGRKIITILEGLVDFFEEAAYDGQTIQEIIGDDIKGFYLALIGDVGAKTYRDKWREELNKNIKAKLGR